MSDLWVVNASPLIVLGKIGQLDLLHQLTKDIVVPSALPDKIKPMPLGCRDVVLRKSPRFYSADKSIHEDGDQRGEASARDSRNP